MGSGLVVRKTHMTSLKWEESDMFEGLQEEQGG